MNEHLVIELDVLGAGKGVAQILQIANQIKALNGAGGAGNNVAKALGAAAGPAARLQKAWSDLQTALKSGDATKIFDAKFQHIQAQKSFQSAQNAINPAGFFQKLKQSFTSGGGGLPNVAEVIKMLPPQVQAAVVAVTAMATAAIMAAKNLNELSKGLLLMGGNKGNVLGLGSAAGVSASGMAGLGRSWNEKALHPGMGAYFAQTIGAKPQNFFGDQDSSKFAKKILDDFFNSADRRATQLAREFDGLDQFQTLRQAGASTREFAKAMGEVQTSIATPTTSKEAAKFGVNLNLLQAAFQNLITALGSGFIPMLNRVLPVITSIINAIAWLIGKLAIIPQYFGLMIDQVFNVLSYGFRRLFGNNGEADKKKMEETTEDFRRLFGMKNDATERNTQALNENTASLHQGVFGGGPRARGAMPAGYQNNPSFATQYAMRTASLGAFAL